jgi:hypothetical protein
VHDEARLGRPGNGREVVLGDVEFLQMQKAGVAGGQVGQPRGLVEQERVERDDAFTPRVSAYSTK